MSTQHHSKNTLDISNFMRSFPLTHWFSLTTSAPKPINRLAAGFKEWLDGMEWLNKAPIGWFWCAEKEPWLHFHGGLIAPNLNALAGEHLWRDIAHGDAQIVRYDPTRGAVQYSFKESYRSGEWDLGNLDYYSVHGRRRRSVLARQCFDVLVASRERRYPHTLARPHNRASLPCELRVVVGSRSRGHERSAGKSAKALVAN